MFAEFLKLAKDSPAVRRGYFVLTDILPEPSRRRYTEHRQWLCNKQSLWTTPAYLETLPYAEVARTAAPAAGDKAPADYPAVLREIVDIDQFPLLHRVTFSGAIDEKPEEPFDEYGFDLDIILDGIEALIARAS